MEKDNAAFSLNPNDNFNEDTQDIVYMKKKQEEESLNIQANNSFLYLIPKRILDIILSFIAIAILSIPCLIVAIFIVIESRGSPIFVQERIGKNGKAFKMYKFRSMYKDAEKLRKDIIKQNEMDGPTFKIKKDPRITKIGKFIRKYSIDELPQLLNIFLGNMTIVGPRPALPAEVSEYTEFQRQRLLAKQGLTCYWQVSGRSEIDFEDWMKLDVKYIGEQNIFTDFKIILKTFPAVFKGDGAW